MFAPATLVALPVFSPIAFGASHEKSMPNPPVSEDSEEARGYVDAAVEIDRYGRCRHVRILDTTDDATRAVEKHVEHVIAQSRFRPKIVDGRVADRYSVVIRYPLND
jgi:hypothetical protein